MAIEPTPPAPLTIKIDLPASAPLRSIFSLSNKASQAVILVRGKAAALAKSKFWGLRPTILKSTK